MESRLFKKTCIVFLVAALATILVSGGLLAACSRTQTSTSTTVSAGDFYRNNVLTITVTTGAGGGTDYAGRLVASFWSEITGGAAVVKNVAGAGGIVGVNNVYSGKTDGLTVGVSMMDTNLLGPTLAENSAVAYDIKKMQWIGWMNRIGVPALGISAKSPINSAADLSKAKGFKMGSSGRFAAGSMSSAVLFEIFGLNDAILVSGYTGSNEVALAAARGEVDGYIMNYFNIMDNAGKGLLKKPFLLMYPERLGYIPDVPPITELVKLSPQQQDSLRLLNVLDATGQVFWTAPDVPQDRIDFLRNAFDKINALDGFKKLAVLRWPQQVEPTKGKDLVAEMDKIRAVVSPEKVKELQALADKYTR